MSLVACLIHHMMFVFMYMGFFISGRLTLVIKEAGSMSCRDNERQVLLDFKANLVDINNNLKDWGNHEKKDCCLWVGVTCNKHGRVTQLDLFTASNGVRSGNITPVLPLLSQLEYLDLSGIDFQLNSIPNTLSSLTNLQYLKISAANLSGSIPDFIETLTSLTELDLSGNQLEGVIPKSFGNWSSLTHLDLSKNVLNGSMPDFDGCPFLENLDLSRNELTGNLPESVGKLSYLEYLDVSSNSLDGLISDVHFLNLTHLNYLDLSFNSFTINLSSHAINSSYLKTIKMQSCKLGPSFPMWIRTQRDFAYLDISNAGISDGIPEWFWDLPYGLKFLNLSSNELKGMIPNITSDFERYPGIDLSYNQFEGTIPVLPSKLAALNLSGNKFSGTLSFLCQIELSLTFLDLSNNLISGGVPDCLQKFQEMLVVLNLSNNKLSGEIPSSLGYLSHLQALYLRRNAFIGEVPMSLRNCTKLKFVDLGENKLSGNIPAWIGETLSELYVLVLRSNRLNGSIPSRLCLLNNLQYLDLSNNELSGNIPRCFGNFTAMATTGFQHAIMNHSYSSYISALPGIFQLKNTTNKHPQGVGNPPYGRSHSSYYIAPQETGRYPCFKQFRLSFSCSYDEDTLFTDNTLVVWKGTRREFGRGLYLLKMIDISSNNLCGKLPYEITNLLGLISLNISINKLQGELPKDMGRLRFLESLDLSKNEFSEIIPSSLSQLTSLSYLDLSYNSFSGRIPLGPQLQLFNSSSYTGNPQLCGPPLTQRCMLPPSTAVVVEKEDEFWKSYYMGIIYGFAVGFWGMCGALILNRGCRYLFFASLININDWIYVTSVVHFRNLRTKFRRF